MSAQEAGADAETAWTETRATAWAEAEAAAPNGALQVAVRLTLYEPFVEFFKQLIKPGCKTARTYTFLLRPSIGVDPWAIGIVLCICEDEAPKLHRKRIDVH